jgi:hypothetical protein
LVKCFKANVYSAGLCFQKRNLNPPAGTKKKFKNKKTPKSWKKRATFITQLIELIIIEIEKGIGEIEVVVEEIESHVKELEKKESAR